MSAREGLARASAELEALSARPLSVRHALLVAALLDRVADLAFAERAALPAGPAAEDVLAFRAAVAAACPALARIAALCGMGAEAPRLAIAAVPVPPEATGALTAAEFMVSLYNANTMPQVVLVEAAGTTPALPVLRAARDWWQAQLA